MGNCGQSYTKSATAVPKNIVYTLKKFCSRNTCGFVYQFTFLQAQH